MPRSKLQPLSDAERAELGAWLAEHRESLPPLVRAALEQHQALCEGLHGSRHKLSQVLFELRRALGIKAMSERRLSKDPLGPLAGGDRTRPKSERERLELDATHLGIRCTDPVFRSFDRAGRLRSWKRRLFQRDRDCS